MKSIRKNRFLVWLMWFVPIACTGWNSIAVWTFIQFLIYHNQINEYKKQAKREDIIEMNKPENLTERDKQIMSSLGCNVKISDRVYAYEKK